MSITITKFIGIRMENVDQIYSQKRPKNKINVPQPIDKQN